MRANQNTRKIVLAAMLTAIGLIIPMFSPIKIILEPASFTLASHVPIFLAMFISPGVALAVALGSTIGFFFGGFPIIIVFRAATHVIFAVLGAMYIKKHPDLMQNKLHSTVFSLVIGVIHALAEVFVSSVFYFDGALSEAYYDKTFLISIVLLVGVGTVIHSMVDYLISLAVWKPISVVATKKTLVATKD